MKNLKRNLALLLAVLMTVLLLPAADLAEAAEDAYTLLCEPNIEGGFENETYSNVAAVWEKIYYDPVTGQIFPGIKENRDRGYWKPMHLMAADSSGVHSVSNWYQKISGLTDNGYAAAQNFEGKWGIINAKGDIIVDFIYDSIYVPNEDGLTLATDNSKTNRLEREQIIDVQTGTSYNTYDYVSSRGLILSRGYGQFGFEFGLVDAEFSKKYADYTIFSNGYAIVGVKSDNGGHFTSNMVIDKNETVIISDADISDANNRYSIGGIYESAHKLVSKEGLVRIQKLEEGRFGGTNGGRYGYINLRGETIIPCNYWNARDFRNGYAVVDRSRVFDSSGNEIISLGGPVEFSDASNTGYIWCRNWADPAQISAVYQLEPCGSQEEQPFEPTDEYIYDTPDPVEDMELPVEELDMVPKKKSAVDVVNDLVDNMTDEEKKSPSCIDLATLYAETAAAKVASIEMDGTAIVIDRAAVESVSKTAMQTRDAVEAALNSGGVTTARSLSSTVTVIVDTVDFTIQINPDILTVGIDKVRIETASCAITFKLSDLSPDLTAPLTFGIRISEANTNTRSSSEAEVDISMPNGKITNPVTISLPNGGGDTTYKAVADASGAATASKYNPATTKMDGKVSTSGKYMVKTNEKDFSDIASKSAEMQKAIRYLASKGIIAGKTATSFEPNGSINRAEIATLLVKALGKLDSSATASFADVTPGNWYYTAAASSQKRGLIKGYDDNTFRGRTDINKVQIVAVSSRVLTTEMDYKAPDNPQTYLSRYSDSVSNWAQSEVALAVKENLVVSRKDGTFSGNKNMTRGDAAIIIYRLFQRIW